MAIVNRTIATRVEVVHEPGEWIEIIPLTEDDVLEAKMAKQIKQMELVQKVDLTVFDNVNINAENLQPAVIDQYDPTVLIQRSIVGWSYQDECNDENKALLDRRTSRWLLNEFIIPLNYLGDQGEDSAS